MQEHAIIKYTERVAGEIASRHAEAPAAELALWLRLAHQREAMVTQLYELSEIEARLMAEPSGVLGLIRSVMLSIWAHEASHTRFLSSVRSVSGSLTDLAELQGRVEGWITRRAANGQLLARLLIAVGAALGKAPEFARELRQMNLAELLAFHAELETTARMGYQRILQVLSRIGAEEATTRELGLTFAYDVARILCEENFHEAAFFEMLRWIDGNGRAAAEFSVEGCTRALHRLCEENLSVGAVRRVAAAEKPGLEAYVPGDAMSPGWLSDGGLGSVFRGAGLAVPVLGIQS